MLCFFGTSVGAATHPVVVTPFSYGKPLDARSVRRKWEKLLERADIPKVKFHALRHTAFTCMAEAEVNPETIRQLAGHSDVRVTLAVYTHPTATMKRQAVSLVGRLYAEAEEEGHEQGTG